MLLKSYEKLPQGMKDSVVKFYYRKTEKIKFYLIFKRIFDIILSLSLIFICSIPGIIIAIMIFPETKGKIIYRQQRVKQYLKVFYIYKFRTMKDCYNSTFLTLNNDDRITKIGKFLRKYRLDELPQLINILIGDMSFVGSRPELPYYVQTYSKEMLATLLLPVGLTSMASITFKDENKLLNKANYNEIYINKILPLKTSINLNYFDKISFKEDIRIIIKTIASFLIKEN